MALSSSQFIYLVLIAGFVFMTNYARVRFPLPKHPAAPGVAYRLLHAYNYLNPSQRKCPTCGFLNSPTAVRCENPIDHGSLSDDLSLTGEFITKESTRLWGLRALIGVIVLTALSLGRPSMIYVALAATTVWIVLPMVSCHREGRVVFSLLSVAILAGIGVIHYVVGPAWRSHMTTVDPMLLRTLHFGSLRFVLNSGVVRPSMVWLNGLCALAALIGVGLSVAVHRQNHNDSFYGPLTVLYLGVLLSALLLSVMSAIQQLTGIEHLYLFVGVVAFGWLLGAYLSRAVAGGFRKVKPRTTPFVTAHPITSPPRPAAPPRPPRRDLTEQLAYTLERILLSTAHTVTVVAIQSLNLVIRVLVAIADTLLRAIDWVLRYIWAVCTTLVKDILVSFPVLFRLASSGFRVALFAPVLLVGAGALLVVSADQAGKYLRVGGPITMVWVVLTFAVAAVIISVVASIFVKWSVVPSFLLTVRDEYLAQALVFFAVFLDLYGIERLFLHQPSHFGLVSSVLNVVLAVAAVRGVVARRARASAVSTP